MNPKEYDGHSILSKYEAADEYDAALDRLQREATRKQLAESKARSVAANKAFNDLSDALGVELHSVSINAATGQLHISANDMQLVADRIKAMTTANALIEGAL
jgi:hypothetical protein